MAFFRSIGAEGPGRGCETATQSDTTDLAKPYRKLRVLVAGNVKMRFADGTEATWDCAAREIIEMIIVRVYTTGTTATGLHGIF